MPRCDTLIALTYLLTLKGHACHCPLKYQRDLKIDVDKYVANSNRKYLLG